MTLWVGLVQVAISTALGRRTLFTDKRSCQGSREWVTSTETACELVFFNTRLRIPSGALTSTYLLTRYTRNMYKDQKFDPYVSRRM